MSGSTRRSNISARPSNGPKRPARDWERWWRTDKGADDVTYVEFMGKDNVAFHTVSFPVTIMGSGEPWKLVDRLKAFNWVTWYGGKFSTSEKRGIFMDQALELLPSDYWRWYLMANAPESSDAAFTLEQFQQTRERRSRQRVRQFRQPHHAVRGVEVRQQSARWRRAGRAEEKLAAEFAERLAALTQCHEQMEFRKAAAELRAHLGRGQRISASRRAVDGVQNRSRRGRRRRAHRAQSRARCSPSWRSPSFPTRRKPCSMRIGVPENNRIGRTPDDAGLLDALPRGHAFTPPDVLFKKIEDTDVAAWAERFGAGVDGGGDALMTV